MSDAVLVAIVSAAGLVLVAVVTVGGGILLHRVGTVKDAVQEVHVMVNARLDAALSRISLLESHLVTSRAETLVSRAETAAAVKAPAVGGVPAGELLDIGTANVAAVEANTAAVEANTAALIPDPEEPT